MSLIENNSLSLSPSIKHKLKMLVKSRTGIKGFDSHIFKIQSQTNAQKYEACILKKNIIIGTETFPYDPVCQSVGWSVIIS